MKITHPMGLTKALISAIFATALGLSGIANAEDSIKRAQLSENGQVSYIEILPDNYDPTRDYPVILAFGGGRQNIDAARGIAFGNLQEQAEARGYIIIAPAAKRNSLFFQRGDRIFPEFNEYILNSYNVLDDKLHVMGLSNGGIAAFHIATRYPDHFASVTTWPGYLRGASGGSLESLRGMCITYYVGSRDTSWVNAARADHDTLDGLGIPHQLTVFEREGHGIRALRGDGAAQIFNRIENCS